jgi:hypothetical protein
MSNGKRTRPSHKPGSPEGSPPAMTPRRKRVVDADAPSESLPQAEPSRLGDSVEWARGKGELFWEARVQPVAGWMGGMLARAGISVGRRRVPRRANELHDWSWEHQGVGMLKGLARIVLFSAISVAVLVLAIAGIVRISAAVNSFNSPINVSLGTSTTPSSGGATRNP